MPIGSFDAEAIPPDGRLFPAIFDALAQFCGAYTDQQIAHAALTAAVTPAGSFTAGLSSLLLADVNHQRGFLQIWNLDPAAVVFGALGTAAVLNSGFVIEPGGGHWSTPDDTGGVVFAGAIYLISTLASTAVSFVEV